MEGRVTIGGDVCNGYYLIFPHGDYSEKIERMWVAIRLRNFWNDNPRLNRERSAP
jgi:hypothetical protein